jgi:hypothetical protein
MTATAQTWWLAVGDEVWTVLGDKSISSKDEIQTILIGQTTLDDV